jgi:hypothetical protein
MNINYSKLSHYTINDYFNKDKTNVTPYLWTSSYGLLSLIQAKKSNSIIKKYISNVHSILGSFDNTNLAQKQTPKLKWFQSLSYEKQTLLNDSVKGLKNIKGGLRIGKAEQGLEPGIYLHYITKWVYSLIVASKHLKNPKYLYLACQLMLTLCEKNIDTRSDGSTYYPRKMDVFLLSPIQTSEISHDPLDVFITLASLIINLKHLSPSLTPTIKLYIKLLTSMLDNNIPRIIEYIDNPKRLNTLDALGIGFLLVSCLKIRLIINYKIMDNSILYKLYELLLKQSRSSLNKIRFNVRGINNDAYRWYGLCIGLEAINTLNYYYINKIFNDKYNSIIKILLKYYGMKRNIIKNFKTYSYNKGNWNGHKDINIVMFINTKYPILYI